MEEPMEGMEEGTLDEGVMTEIELPSDDMGGTEDSEN